MDEILTLTLKRPIKLGELEITELRLEEPIVAHIEQATKEATGVASNVALIALVAKIPPAAVRLMLTSDFNRAVGFLQGFTQEPDAASP